MTTDQQCLLSSSIYKLNCFHTANFWLQWHKLNLVPRCRVFLHRRGEGCMVWMEALCGAPLHGRVPGPMCGAQLYSRGVGWGPCMKLHCMVGKPIWSLTGWSGHDPCMEPHCMVVGWRQRPLYGSPTVCLGTLWCPTTWLGLMEFQCMVGVLEPMYGAPQSPPCGHSNKVKTLLRLIL